MKKIFGGLLILSGIGLLIGAMNGKEVGENMIFSLIFIGCGIFLLISSGKKPDK